MPRFADRLTAQIVAKSSCVVVGIDPRTQQLPAELQPHTLDWNAVANAYLEFSRGIVDVVASLVPAVKPQAAFFEELGPPGMQALASVVDYAHAQGLLVILDGKRNDIGSTADAYANAYLGPDSAWRADALTVSPYLGDDSIEPFVKRCRDSQTGIYVLVKTSNPGGQRWQDLVADGQRVYEHVGDFVEQLAADTLGDCGYGSIGAVVGATYPEELYQLRQRMPHCLFLVPGFGTQGGTAVDVQAAFDSTGLGALVNSSRGIIFAHQRPEYQALLSSGWQRAVEQATRDMNQQLNEYRH